VERVRSGQLDIAIVGDIAYTGRDLMIRQLTRDSLMVALPARHPAADNLAVTFSDLGDTSLFWFSRSDNPAFYDRCELVFRDFSYSPLRRPEPDDHAQLLARVAAGDGLAFLPSSLRVASRIGVVYRRFQKDIEQRLGIEIQLIWRASELREEVLGVVRAIQATVCGDDAIECDESDSYPDD
jgi:DNA-binding transcriptional LysR family regulator